MADLVRYKLNRALGEQSFNHGWSGVEGPFHSMCAPARACQIGPALVDRVGMRDVWKIPARTATRVLCHVPDRAREEHENRHGIREFSNLLRSPVQLSRASLLGLQKFVLGKKQKPTCQLFLGGGSKSFS